MVSPFNGFNRLTFDRGALGLTAAPLVLNMTSAHALATFHIIFIKYRLQMLSKHSAPPYRFQYVWLMVSARILIIFSIRIRLLLFNPFKLGS